jgi:hypothetical protein
MDGKITLKSGAMVELQDPGFDAADDLFAAVMAEIGKARLDLDLSAIDPDAEVSTLAGENFNSVKNLICQVAGSKPLRGPLFAAAARSLYNGLKIERATFEDINARSDFLPVAQEVMKFVLAPFFKNLDLKSLLRPEGPTKSRG